MLKHKDIWKAIDLLAESHGLSASGLAKQAGLDSTSFNPSKRIAKDGKPRWPSTESLSKILDCTGEDFDRINQLINPDALLTTSSKSVGTIPVASCIKASFDDNGMPTGDNWDNMEFPNLSKDNIFALEVSDDTMEPLYRQGDIMIVEPNAQNLRRGDRIVVKTIGGDIMTKQLNRIGKQQVSLGSINDKQYDITLDKDDISWIVRILWVSQ